MGWWPGFALALAINSADTALRATAIGLAVAILGAAIAGAAWYRLRGLPDSATPFPALRRSVRLWDAGDVTGLNAWLVASSGAEQALHASRTAGLIRMMADQLALPADAVDEVVLAGLLHAGPAEEQGEGCGWRDPETLRSARDTVARMDHPWAARVMGETRERWDGTGTPNGLAGEECSLGGRILATACAFDIASGNGLEAGLAVMRADSGSRFDPVVAAELIHLFREPWQLRQAA